MLKTMDQIGRLTIVDGDTDTPAVQDDFRNVIRDLVDYIKNSQATQPPELRSHPQLNGNTVPVQNGSIPNGHHIPHEAEIEDLEREPLETISQKVGNGVANGVANGFAKGVVKNINGVANGFANGVNHVANGYGHTVNGHIANGHGPKKLVKEIANGGLPTYDRLANDRGVHNEVNYMDAHI